MVRNNNVKNVTVMVRNNNVKNVTVMVRNNNVKNVTVMVRNNNVKKLQPLFSLLLAVSRRIDSMYTVQYIYGIANLFTNKLQDYK
jgi:hypothetical protein